MPGASPFSMDMDVRWGDMDAFGHVNNTMFLRYLEEIRIEWFSSMDGDWENPDVGPVVANVNCNFRAPIHWPARLRVTLSARRASEKRVVLEHTIDDARNEGVRYCDAEITLLWIDRRKGGTIPPPATVIEAIGA